MDKSRELNRKYEAIAWGAFFIWFGIVNLLKELPPGASALGIAVILLGLNLARFASGIPVSGFTTTLGVVALVLGAADLLRLVTKLDFDLPVVPILLITIGVIWVVRGLTRSKNSTNGNE